MSSDPPRDPERPDPEELLDRHHLRDAPPAGGPSPQRGRLRIYLGMAAGVGKTYAMLNEGRRRRSRGTDVVIGYVETHNRPLTAHQIGDLEIVPRQRLVYRGGTFEEMDVDAVLARQPQVALVDELAHTNVPGAHHEKRYQDVEELLAAGITVISTLNIQHLESLNDMVEAITGVRPRETLPDRVLDEADEVELVDMSPEALRARLRHGNVYPPDEAQRALDGYFSVSNLTALRELALRRLAQETEEKLEGLREGHEEPGAQAGGATAIERVLVAFDARPHSAHVLREGGRLAHALIAPLLAVTVICPRRFFAHSGSGGEAALKAHLQLARDLGAEVISVQGCDVAAELARVARERHVTQIVIGQPQHSRWHELLLGSVVNRLVREATGANMHIVPHARPRNRHRLDTMHPARDER